MSHEENTLEQKKALLESLILKCEFQNKEIKLLRKENQQMEHNAIRQKQVDASLLLNSKQLTEINNKLEQSINEISKRLEFKMKNATTVQDIKQNQMEKISVVTINNTIVTQITQQVDLTNQGITDKNMEDLKRFCQIKSLILGHNLIEDEGVEIICNNFPEIQKIQLMNNRFRARSLSNISKLGKLKILDVRGNKLGDESLKYIRLIANLQELSISNNQITDEGVSQLSQMKSLKYLDATTNLITDKGIFDIVNLQKLTHLYLMSNKLTIVGVKLLFDKLKQLLVFDIRFNSIMEQEKQQIQKCSYGSLHLIC